MPELHFSCPEDITSMPKTSCGFFCTGCNKEVIDFRKSASEKIEEHLRNQPGKTCGVFNPSQLSAPTRSQVSTWFRFAFAVIFILGINTETFAQENDTLSQPVVLENAPVIEGYILDESGTALPFSKIYAEHDGIRTVAMADSDGRFKLVLPAGTLGKTVTIKARSVAYKEYVDTIQTLQALTSNYTITLEEAPIAGITVVVVGYTKPLISNDPYDAGKTTFSAEDIRRIAK